MMFILFGGFFFKEDSKNKVAMDKKEKTIYNLTRITKFISKGSTKIIYGYKEKVILLENR